MSQHTPDNEMDDDVAVAPAPPELRRPPMWQVVMINDNFTPMEFVVAVLVTVFGMDLALAATRMMEVHEKGRAVVGVYRKEVAEMKVSDTMAWAEQEGHPLRVVLQKIES